MELDVVTEKSPSHRVASFSKASVPQLPALLRPAGTAAVVPPGLHTTTPSVVETDQTASPRTKTWRVEPPTMLAVDVALALRVPTGSERTPPEVPTYRVEGEPATPRNTELASVQEAARSKAPLGERRPTTFLLEDRGATPGATDQQGRSRAAPSEELPM